MGLLGQDGNEIENELENGFEPRSPLFLLSVMYGYHEHHKSVLANVSCAMAIDHQSNIVLPLFLKPSFHEQHKRKHKRNILISQ